MMKGVGVSNLKSAPTFLCIGHRGAMGHAPENTLLSIRTALELGTPCVEVDVRYVDGQLIVFHDEELQRLTNVQGCVEEQSFEYLRSLKVAGQERIPTLEEVCREVGSEIGLNIELKGENTVKAVLELISLLSKQGFNKEMFLLSSFEDHKLLEARSLDIDIKLGVLRHQLSEKAIELANSISAYSLHLSRKNISKKAINESKATTRKVYVYTVNTSEEMLMLANMGVDGVFSDFPEKAVALFKQGNAWS